MNFRPTHILGGCFTCTYVRMTSLTLLCVTPSVDPSWWGTLELWSSLFFQTETQYTLFKFIIFSLFLCVQSWRDGWGGLQCHLGLKRSEHITAPRPNHLEPWIASLELHYSEAAPISLAPNHSWSTEWRQLTKAHFRGDYKANRKAIEWEFVWKAIKTMIIPADQQNYL